MKGNIDIEAEDEDEEAIYSDSSSEDRGYRQSYMSNASNYDSNWNQHSFIETK